MGMLRSLPGDFRLTLRMLRKHPGFSAVATATLALGIGANTAMFTVVDHVLLQPLAYRDANRLVAIQEGVPAFANLAPWIPVNAMHFLAWKRNVHAFEEIALLDGGTVNLTGSGAPMRIPSARASWNLFAMLGVRPELGRLFAKEENQPGHDHVVILTQ